MDAPLLVAVVGACAAPAAACLAIVKVLVDRHLAALTRLETRAEANTTTMAALALAFDAVREHLASLKATQDRTLRHVVRLLDHSGLSEHESAPMPAPAEIPRAATITGQFRAVSASGHDPG